MITSHPGKDCYRCKLQQTVSCQALVRRNYKFSGNCVGLGSLRPIPESLHWRLYSDLQTLLPMLENKHKWTPVQVKSLAGLSSTAERLETEGHYIYTYIYGCAEHQLKL
jgi:hypothetical protein